MSDLKAGFRCDFFLLTEGEPEKGRARRSLLYESDPLSGRLVIAQPSPPLPPSCVGKQVQFTYIARRTSRQVRLGFRAKILSLLDRYVLASHQRVPAILLEQIDRSCPFDIRQCFRIKPVPADMLTLSLAGERLRLIDLSLGGAVVNGLRIKDLRPQERISLVLTIEGQQFRIEAEVVRAWPATGWEPGVIAPALAAVRFIALPNACENALGRKILFWERKRLAQDQAPR